VDGVDVDFQKLIQLQELDTSLKQISGELSDLPQLIGAIEKKIQAGSDHVLQAQEQLTRNQKKGATWSLKSKISELNFPGSSIN